MSASPSRYPDADREPLTALAQLLARQAVAEYLTADSAQNQRDTDDSGAARPNRGISPAPSSR